MKNLIRSSWLTLCVFVSCSEIIVMSMIFIRWISGWANFHSIDIKEKIYTRLSLSVSYPIITCYHFLYSIVDCVSIKMDFITAMLIFVRGSETWMHCLIKQINFRSTECFSCWIFLKTFTFNFLSYCWHNG